MIAAMLVPGITWAQTATDVHPSQIKSELTEPLAIVLVVIALLLLAVIAMLSRGIIIGADIFRKNKFNKNTTLLLFALLAPMALLAQEADAEAATQVVSTTIGGISNATFYLLSGIIILEIIIILMLLAVFYALMGVRKTKAVKTGGKKIHWIEKLNASPASKGITDEELGMGHDFDGIEELDNPSPPWWNWFFILSIVSGVIYLWVYNVTGTGLNQYEELARDNEKAEAAIKAYLEKSANNVDENTVTFLNNESDIAAGQAIFTQVCAACHAPDGGGNAVGPNLTDQYWLHGGSINNIFKTIKYGVVEKGMKSWQDDYSPMQIAQLASFIKSLQGSTPAEPKAPQGELYTEAPTASEEADSTANTSDTIKDTLSSNQ